MVLQVAIAIEGAFYLLRLPSDPLLHADHTLHRRKDPALKYALAMKTMKAGWAKNGKRLAKSSEAVGRQLGCDLAKTRREYMAAYLKKATTLFVGCKQIARCGDAARIGQKRLLSAVMDLNTGLTAWAPPKVHSFSSCQVVETLFMFF